MMRRAVQVIALALASLLITATVAEAAGGGRRRRGGNLPPRNSLRETFNRHARGRLADRFNRASGVRSGSSTPTPRPRGPYFRPNGGAGRNNRGPRPGS